MEKPNYVLKANEGITVPKNDNLLVGIFKIAVWILVLVIIISSIFFRDNMFSKISCVGIILLIALAVRLSLAGYKSVPSPFEIHFYDEYLTIYREKAYRSRNFFRKEYDKFFYKDIKKCEYRTISEAIYIQGTAESVFYEYNKDGSLSDKPSFHKICENLCFFNTNQAPEINFIAEIESHSPVKVYIAEGR